MCFNFSILQNIAFIVNQVVNTKQLFGINSLKNVQESVTCGIGFQIFILKQNICNACFYRYQININIKIRKRQFQQIYKTRQNTMKKKQSQCSPTKISSPTKKDNKNPYPPKKFKFYLGSRERYIIISSDFDSGNIDFVRQINQFQYRLCSVHDGTFTDHKVNSKSWFYFSVTGFPPNTRGKFIIAKIQTLQGMYYSKYSKSYRPVYKIGEQGEWQRIPTQTELVMRQNGQLQCVFDFQFRKENDKVYFAFCYPFTYTDYLKYMNSLNEFIYNDDFYFHKEILIKSPQDRDIHLITITSYDHQDKTCQNEQIFHENIFPEKCRPLKFKKPVVFISARVHPGETPASFAMKGVIDFLTKKNDLRVNLLRKMFVFMIVPMINVDGVFHGHFRMDYFGKNLNRFYLNPDQNKQPAVFAIKQLIKHLNQENRLTFYFDLHAHNAKKGHFIYGNAINDFVEQVESQVFCKLISLNHRGFEYQYCNFTEKHMKAKDRGEDLTKEGCGRVVMYRFAKIIHSYSVQCGIVSPNKMNFIPDAPNTQFQIEEKGFQLDRCENNTDPIYKTNNSDNALFTPEMYQNLGKNLMVSILDAFDKNPYNRVYNSKYKTMDMLRRLTAFQIFHEAQRFRMFERFVFGKVKNINQLIRQVLNTKLHYKKLYNFYFFDDKQLKNIEWPENIPGLMKPKPPESPTKLRRFKSSQVSVNNSNIDYSESFMKILMSISGKQSQKIQKEYQNQQMEIGQENDINQDDNSSSQTEDFEPDSETIKYINNLELMIENPNISEAQKINIATKLAQIYQSNNIKMEQEQSDLFSNIRNLSDINIQQICLSPKKRQSLKSEFKDEIQKEEKIKNQSKNTQKNMDELELSTKLCMFRDDQNFISNSPDKKKQSPSMRVRRLLKQQFLADAQIKLLGNKNQSNNGSEGSPNTLEQLNSQRIKKMSKKNFRSSTTAKTANLNHTGNPHFRQNSPQKNISSAGLQLKKNIYESIKQEIKEELKRQHYKEYNKIYSISNNSTTDRAEPKTRRNKQASVPTSISISSNSANFYACNTSHTAPKICSPVKIQKQRIKSWKTKAGNSTVQGLNQIKNNNSKNKLQLPALGNQMYILSTSTKAFLKKN